MIIACATTTKLLSETANSIQAVMACEGLCRSGAEIQLFVPGAGDISFDEVRAHYLSLGIYYSTLGIIPSLLR